MTTLNIQLPEDLRKKAEAEAARRGHSSISDYLCSLLKDDLDRESDSELETELLKGLDSPAEEMTDEDWDQMRGNLVARSGKKQG